MFRHALLVGGYALAATAHIALAVLGNGTPGVACHALAAIGYAAVATVTYLENKALLVSLFLASMGACAAMHTTATLPGAVVVALLCVLIPLVEGPSHWRHNPAKPIAYLAIASWLSYCCGPFAPIAEGVIGLCYIVIALSEAVSKPRDHTSTAK